MDKNGFRLVQQDGSPAEIGQLVSTESGDAAVLAWAFAPEVLNADDKKGTHRLFFGNTILANTGDFTIQVAPEVYGLRWTKVR